MKKLRLRNILVPIDFSPMSISAIDYAKRIASRFEATVHLVHVHEFIYPIGFKTMPIGIADTVPDWSITFARQIEAQLLQDVRAQAALSDLSPDRCYVRRGAPVFDEICRCADDIGADLIVTPTHGRTGLKHVFLGSTAERLVQHSPCPVLVTRGSAAGSTDTGSKRGIDRILVPVDFSSCSLGALQYGIQLAQKTGARITILHVIDFGFALTADGCAMYDLSRYQELARKQGERTMRRFLEKMTFGGVKFDSVIVAGLFLETLNQQIMTRDIDLVVTATHGRTGLKHIVIGSTAEIIVRRTTCPVLVVPSHSKERTKNLEHRGRHGHLGTTPRNRITLPADHSRQRSAFAKRTLKVTAHPFPERRKTNKFRESHLMIS
jgi:nucleotide-binding universal stress UspA family protein